jgi:hypothetical protein
MPICFLCGDTAPSVVFGAKNRTFPYENMQKSRRPTLEGRNNSFSIRDTSKRARSPLVLFNF